MENICKFDSVCILGTTIVEKDINTLAETLYKVSEGIDVHELKNTLKDHWANMVICIKYSVENENNFKLNRREIFKLAYDKGLLKTYPEKGDLVSNWAEEILREIEEGRLAHFSNFKLQTIESRSLIGNFNRKKYKITLGALKRFYRTANRKIDSLNDKAFCSIDEFTSWAHDRSIDKPWLSPLFIFVIVLLALFTLSTTVSFDLSIGIFSVLYNTLAKICLICAIYFGGKHVYHLGTEFLENIGLIG